MTPRQRDLVVATWARLDADEAATAAILYRRVLDMSPNARRLFGGRNMHLQGTLFMQMLDVFIRSLSGEAEATTAVEECGRRHIGYGVSYTDYNEVGRAMLAAFEEILGASSFGSETRAAWEAAYGTLAASMRQGSSGVV